MAYFGLRAAAATLRPGCARPSRRSPITADWRSARPGTLAVEHQPAGRLGFDHHGVEGAVDRRPTGASSGTSAGYTRAETRCLPSPLVSRSQMASSLIDAAERLGRLEVRGADLGDALAVDIVGGHPGVERDEARMAALAAASVALDIRGRVGLGVAQRAGIGEGARVDEAPVSFIADRM